MIDHLEIAQRIEPFDLRLYDEDDGTEETEMDRQEELRRCTNDLLLVERTKEWLFEDIKA